MSRARELAEVDIVRASSRPFSLGTRPVIRWIKGDGRDDEVTRSAIAQATRIFGDRVDYCMCSAGISAARARAILAWSDQPVEWWPLGPEDNPQLSNVLMAAGCPSDAFGYWWKWFPERLRPAAPEWIVDGDMVITGKPAWFDEWCAGTDCLRVAQDDHWDANELYGEYRDFIDLKKRLYSGLISLPPNLSYLPHMLAVLAVKPLAPGHDGRVNMSEQGVIACTFGALGAEPIPLAEFPFGRAFQEEFDYGLKGPSENIWGYHFGQSFRVENAHFRRLTSEGSVYWRDSEPPLIDRFNWLKNFGQWGIPGWAMPPGCTERVSNLAHQYAGRRILDIGTSRGRLAAILATHGCIVTTVDQVDRGASTNLMQMGVQTVVSDAADFLRRMDEQFAMIVVDIHDNSEEVWSELWPLLGDHVESDGSILLSNSHLWQMPEWHEETGLRWITEASPAGWTTEVFPDPEPGMVICRRVSAVGRNSAPIAHMPDDDDAVKTKVGAALTTALIARFADRHAELQQAGRETAELLTQAAGYVAALDTARGEIDTARAELTQWFDNAKSDLVARCREDEQLISQYAVQLTKLVNDLQSEATEGERRAAALLGVAQSEIDERERQIGHLKSELASLRGEWAVFETSVQTQLEELRQRVGTLVTGAETWLIPTVAKHGAALQRRRRHLGPFRFW
jgi:hypothetical protein